MSIVELLFVVSFFLPPAAVILGAGLLAIPSRRSRTQPTTAHAHAH